jgi:hypothetical protein
MMQMSAMLAGSAAGGGRLAARGWLRWLAVPGGYGVGEILRRVGAESALLAAWEKVRDSAYADGDPGAGVVAFERRALRGLTALAVELGRGSCGRVR